VKRVIVTTTINAPTEAVLKYDAMPGWELVVMGDLTTPKDYRLENGIYVTPQEQEKYDRELSDAIGWNCIQRRNFGFLWARARPITRTSGTADSRFNSCPRVTTVTSRRRRSFRTCRRISGTGIRISMPYAA